MAAFEIAGRNRMGFAAGCGFHRIRRVFWAAATFVGLRKDSLTGKALWRRFADRRDLRSSFHGHGRRNARPGSPHRRLGRRSSGSLARPSPWRWRALRILLLTAAGLAVDFRDRATRPVSRPIICVGSPMPLVEGLLVCDGETIVAANEAFTALSGMDADKVLTTSLATVFPDEDIRSLAFKSSERIGRGQSRSHGRRADPPWSWSFTRSSSRKSLTTRLPCAICRVRKRAEAHIRHLADHDVLTGLPNRRSFTRKFDHEIAAAKASGQKRRVLCLDLDKFKEVNDLFGHAAGDRLLQAVARCVSSVSRREADGGEIGRRRIRHYRARALESCRSGPNRRKRHRSFPDRKTRIRRTRGFMSTSIGIAIFPMIRPSRKVC